MSDEKVFIDRKDVKVTNTRFIAGGKTYPIANITSVSTAVEKPSKNGPIITFAIGIFPFMAGFTGDYGMTIVGVVMFLIAGFWRWWQSPEYSLVLSSASGEVEAYESGDEDLILNIEEALSDAIVSRG